MCVLHDPDKVLGLFKEPISVHPDDLAQAVLDDHIDALGDLEDLKLAVNRKDVFFFHFALDHDLRTMVEGMPHTPSGGSILR